MLVATFAELPEKHTCLACNAEKPVGEMVVIRRRAGGIYLRPRCKACHNTKERGHRREWKRKYLQRWRKWNAEINESYWRQRNQANRAEITKRAYARFLRDHDAILIQGRLRRQAGMSVSIKEARALLKKFGRCYPTRFGLTPGGLKECERIRSRMRSAKTPMRPIEIRMMVYADGLFIKPKNQPVPYLTASHRLHEWHRERKVAMALERAA